jgi:plastocyanin
MAEHMVVIENMAYNPDPQVIAAGDEVYWVNRESRMRHSATAKDGSFDTGILKPGETSKKFKVEKSTQYYCVLHESMQGAVRVPGADEKA